jgi:nucleotide-binding universal stress UspA family protein
MKLNKILVPLDGSTLAESAVAKAVEVAGDRSVTLMLLRAAEAHTLPGIDPTEAQVEVVREAEEYLATVAAGLKRQWIKGVETSVWYGPAAAAIVDAARLRKADMIVMSTHGRSGLGRLILGSVAESVLRGTTTPRLLLRAPEAPVEAPAGISQARLTKETSHV